MLLYWLHVRNIKNPTPNMFIIIRYINAPTKEANTGHIYTHNIHIAMVNNVYH